MVCFTVVGMHVGRLHLLFLD